MQRRFTRPAVLVAAMIASLSLCAAAQAASTTVGASFALPEVFKESCTFPGGCSFLLLKAESPASGAISPVDGTVVRWRIQNAGPATGYVVNVLRKNAEGRYTVTASSPPATTGSNLIETFTVNLPIHAGEYVELNLPEGGGIGVLKGNATEATFGPALKPEESRAPFFEGENPVMLAWNADIESAPPAPTPVVPAPVVIAPSPAPVGAPSPAPVGAPSPAHCVVPKLKGKKLKAAKKMLRAADCKIGLVTKNKGMKATTGTVVKQSPKSGKVRPGKTAVRVTLG
jgi:hypothetical protein